MLRRIKEWYDKQNDSTKALLWIGAIALIGIVCRWNHILEQARIGFQFYSGK